MITPIISNNNLQKKQQSNPGFKGNSFSILTGGAKAADLFIRSQENLSSTRFIQDTVTNWVPKAVFARSKADFAEMSFLEFFESAIFYFATPLLGERVFRKHLFKNIVPKDLRKNVDEQLPKRIHDIASNVSPEVKKRAISTKAGIVLACALVPAAEFALSFAKNLFTLKTFKKSNFNSIANLDKSHSEKEDTKQQKRVETHAKKELKKALGISLAGIGAGCLLAAFGHKSETLQKLSKSILEPGEACSKVLHKAGINNKKTDDVLKKFSLDFAPNNNKLTLGKGQLALTAILGLFGYSKAAKDRGKLDCYEVWTRVPLVVFYTIFGSELFEKTFTKILNKKNKFPDLITKNEAGKVSVPSRKELPKMAEKAAKTKNTLPENELKTLVRQKAFVTAVPYAFSLLFMGFSLSAITRLWTQYRYNHLEKPKPEKTTKPPVATETSSVFKQISTPANKNN